MAWAENNYIETRFVGGMNCSVEPHTLDRDTGELPDIMNMVCRTQALRTRKGFVRINDLAAEYSSMPVNAPSALFHFEYEPDLPAETTEETEEETVTGGAVIPDITGGGGSGGGNGGGGNVKPKPEPEPEPAPEPAAMWSVTGPGSIYPYVPFELTITRNSGYGKPTWLMGVLVPSSAGSYKGTEKWLSDVSAGVWKREVMATNLNRSITDIIYKAGSSSSSYGQCELDYALYGFYPDLPDAVTVGESFEFKVECRDVNVISNYKGNGRGCGLAWTFLKANGQPASGTVSVTGATWTNGVMKANCVANTVDGVTLRLTTTFLGEEHSDVAAINIGEVGIEVDESPIALHIYGKGSTLQISATGAFSPSHLSVACTLGGAAANLNDVLELATEEGGSRAISFASGWSAQNVWSKSVRAKANAANAGGTLHIVFSYEYGDDRCTATADIDIEGTIIGSFVASPSSIYSGNTVSLTATISGNVDVGLDIARVPFSAMFLAHADGDGFTVTPSKDITDDDNWSESGTNLVCAFDAEITGTTASLPATLRYSFGMSNEVLAYVDIAVALPNYAAMLAEAINERNLAKGTTTAYTGEEGATLLRGYAIAACAGYVNADGVSASGAATSYTDTGSGVIPIDAADERTEWYKTAYEKVCEAVCRSADATRQVREKSASGSYQYEAIWDPDSGQYIPSGTESGAKSNAKQNFDNNKTVGDWGSGSISESFLSSSTGQDYEAWGATISAVIMDFRVKASGSSLFSRQADYYYQAKRLSGSSSDSTYSNLGHHSLSLNETGKLSSANADAQGEFAWDEHTFTLDGSWVSYRGYRLEFKSCFVTYGFRHK